MPPTPAPGAQPPLPAKRAVNLTAAAFSFGTPSPGYKAATSKGKGKERDVRPTGISGAAAAFQTPRKEVVKQERATVVRPGGPIGGATLGRDVRAIATPIRDITRPSASSAVRLSSLMPMGMLGDVKREEKDERSSKTPRKMTTLSSITTPWSIPSRSGEHRPVTPDADVASSSKRRRLGDLDVHLPGPKVKDEKEDLGRKVALRQMGEGVRLEGIGQTEAAGKDEMEKEVGIGISPRKGKVKWMGKGERPLALRLNALLTTQTSSLTLFYTSLQHTLHPSHASNRSTYGAAAKGKSDPSPTTLDHVRTAPLRLVLLRPLSPREHTAQLWLASVRTWSEPHGTFRTHTSDPERASPDQVIVNFSQAAKGAAAASAPEADIKVIAGKWWDRVERAMPGNELVEGKWEVGVWSEWSMLEMPTSDKDVFGGHGESGDIQGRKVVFVTRYLIAERETSLK